MIEKIKEVFDHSLEEIKLVVDTSMVEIVTILAFYVGLFKEDDISTYSTFTNSYKSLFVILVMLSFLLILFNFLLSSQHFKFMNSNLYRDSLAPVSSFLLTFGIFGIACSYYNKNLLLPSLITIFVASVMILIISIIKKSIFTTFINKFYLYSILFYIVFTLINYFFLKINLEKHVLEDFLFVYLTLISIPSLFYNIIKLFKKRKVVNLTWTIKKDHL